MVIQQVYLSNFKKKNTLCIREIYPLVVYTQCVNICNFFWERVSHRWSASNAINETILAFNLH